MKLLQETANHLKQKVANISQKKISFSKLQKYSKIQDF